MPAIPADRATRESYIATLLMLAEADDNQSIRENRFIELVALRLGLTEEDVQRIDQHPEQLSFHFPKGEQERMNLLYHLLFLMKIDGAVTEAEVALCHQLGTLLGFNYLMVDELIAVMTQHIGRKIPDETLLNIIRKYMN